MFCSACGVFGSSGIEQTALNYYEFRLGHRPGLSYSSFFSPEYRKLVSKADLDLLDSKLTYRDGSNTRYAEVKLKDIAVSQEARYALTLFRGQESAGLDGDDVINWVRVGSKWYLHMGTDSEGAVYGDFPTNLPLPDLTVEEDPAS